MRYLFAKMHLVNSKDYYVKCTVDSLSFAWNRLTATMGWVNQLIHLRDELVQIHALLSHLSHTVLQRRTCTSVTTSKDTRCLFILLLSLDIDPFFHQIEASIQHHIVVCEVVFIKTLFGVILFVLVYLSKRIETAFNYFLLSHLLLFLKIKSLEHPIFIFLFSAWLSQLFLISAALLLQNDFIPGPWRLLERAKS